MLLKNILDIANKHFFFSPILTKNSKNVLFYQLGPSGSLFQDNIKSEWIYSNVTNRDASIFLFAKNTCDKRHDNQTYMNVRDICNGQLPFGVAKISTRSSEAQDVHNITENSYFNSLVRTCLSTQMYMPPSEGMHFFFDWQRQRKLWWKKMSAFPGRYLLGEVTKSADEKITSVNVLANFSWGNQILEKISVMSLDEDSDVDLTVRHQRKSVIPMVIRSELSLECAVVGLFSDALDSDSVHKKPVLRIHRKLAPYKCIFAASSSDPTTAMELEQLAFYLTKQFRKSGISTACLPDCAKDTLPHQRNDEWGIPYTIVLDDNSLKSGIVNLRNRDTTLTEEVHVSELSPYITQIFKNF